MHTGNVAWGIGTYRHANLPGAEVSIGGLIVTGKTRNPVDEGTRRVVADGESVIYDPEGLLSGLLDACGKPEATNGCNGSGVSHA